MNLKELSALLGLSQTTVSRALNGYPEVSEATREKVAEAARQHNYRPNVRAKGLATGQALSIGHIIPVSTKHEIVNPIFSDFIAGAGEVYGQNGYDLHLTVVADTAEEKAYRELATRGAVDGLVVHGPRPDDTRIALLRDIGLPFAVHGRTGTDDGGHTWVDVDNFAAFDLLTRHLTGLGHRRIALVNGIEKLDFAIRRRAGFEAALAAAGITPDPSLMSGDEMTEGYGFARARALLDRPQPPTAFAVSSMIAAIGVRRAVQALGMTPGREVSIAIFDDDLSYLPNGVDAPIFTAVRSSVRAAGSLLAQALVDKIADPMMAPRQIVLDPEFVQGASTGPCPS